MQAFGIGQAADLLGVSRDTVRRWIDAGKLAATKTSGGHRTVTGLDLARFAQSMTAAVTPRSIAAESARNRFPGLVTKVTKGKIMAQVEIISGPHRVVSLISREAADELQLAPGVLAVATVKATSVVVELPVSKTN